MLGWAGVGLSCVSLVDTCPCYETLGGSKVYLAAFDFT